MYRSSEIASATLTVFYNYKNRNFAIAGCWTERWTERRNGSL